MPGCVITRHPMIRMTQSTSAGHAKAYFAEALLKADYYLSDQELNGEYQGKLAAHLGLHGPATKEGFFALCENINPASGDPLTPRTNRERTTGYDITFNCPKSVSIVSALSKDDHVVEAFRQSFSETMTDIESDARTRVRIGKADEDRHTGNLLWVDFVHKTARPVDGTLPDPHLHAHCYTFNVTRDPVEDRIKAAQFRQIKRDMPYYQAMFHKRLSDKLTDLGYGVRRTKNSFELEGVPQRVIDLFSKRTDEIGRMAKEKGITDAKTLDGLGARTRAKKQKGLSMDELKTEWRSQIKALTPSWEDHLTPVRFGPKKDLQHPSAGKCLGFALGHSFEKASVIPARRLLATAYREAIGAPETKIESIDQVLNTRADIIHAEEGYQHVCTTKEILKEEQRMVAMARAGRGQLVPLYAQAPKLDLNGKQAEAVRHVLTTPDRVSIIRGAAGTGKTTLMREAVSHIEKAGKRVTVLAPTSTAARDVLQKEGFEKADTVAMFITDRKRQDEVRNGVLWVDEAGMLGTADMSVLLEIAEEKNARLILGGDTRQHASVMRGDALRVLNKIGKIRTAEVTEIYRQKDARYRDAVKDLSEGNVKAGFEKFDAIGSIVSVDREQPNAAIVQDYIGAVKLGKSVQVLSPVNANRKALTTELRDALRKEGMIGKREAVVGRLENLHLSGAEKESWKSYRPGQLVQFSQNTTGIKAGSRWTIADVSEKGVVLTDGQGKTRPLPEGRTSCFSVFAKSELKAAKGDRLMVTHNAFDSDRNRLNNGALVEVQAVRKDGRLTVKNPVSKNVYHLDKEFGHIDHALCMTSYASQGRTVDQVLIAQPADTFPGTNAKQFYVSVSRARERVRIYTDDKEELLAHAQRAGDRTAALEIKPSGKRHKDHVEHMQREKGDTGPEVTKEQSRSRQGPEHSPVLEKDRDYEPGF